MPGPVMGLFDLQTSGLRIGLVLGLGLLLVLLLQVGAWLVSVVPMSKDRRQTVRRVGPVVTAVLALTYAFIAGRILFDQFPNYVPAVLLGIIGVAVGLSWSVLRDFVSGFFVRAGLLARVGDRVKVGGLEGRVERIGIRALTLETADGQEAVLPYSEMVGRPLQRSRDVSGSGLVRAVVPIPDGRDVAWARGRLREASLSNHWCSSIREPEINLTDDGRLEVTVSALDPGRNLEIEAMLRKSLVEKTT